MDVPYHKTRVASQAAISHLYRTGRAYHAYIRAVQSLPSAPPPRLPTPPPLPPPPSGSILTAIPWLVKELTGELFGLPVLDPQDPEATAPVVRPTTPLPPPPPSPPARAMPVYFRPLYHGLVPTRLIIPSWQGRNGTVSVAVSDPSAPSLSNIASWSTAATTEPTSDLPPIKMPRLSENLFGKLL